MNPVFQIETIIDRLFDEVCPPIGTRGRALKPLLAPVLGELMPDPNVRELVSNREYYRVDFADFADYATSTLPTEPLTGSYPDNRALVFEGIDRRPEEPLFTTSWFGKDFGLSILDAVITRFKVFVSVTIRLLVYRDPKRTYRQQYGDLDPEDVAGATVLTTMLFAAKILPGTASLDRRLLDKQPLEEWDRYYIMPPIPSDLEWRFILSGTYTDSFLDECLQNPHRPGGITPDQIQRIRDGGKNNGTTYAVEFELARLALVLPYYVRFMYDLVVKEKVLTCPTARPAKGRRGTIQSGTENGTRYRTIKSIRVIRPQASVSEHYHRRPWSPPSHRIAIRGHWRALGDQNRTGRDQYGKPVPGRTWVRDYEKGLRTPYPFPTSTENRSSSVVINIKEPLSYGRDVLLSQEVSASQPNTTHKSLDTSERTSSQAAGRPSLEWRAQERAKLTAGLRYFILRRDSYKCRLCGRSAADENGVKLEVDHRLSIDQWGRTEETNLWTLCRDCNRGKGAESL
ncbi:MAG TPA: HNH endonuclease [Thermoanaerobaculia bacterium]|jgi:5-methylcytosine-specific restriction endonuclease McrA|nr:HNH endonuclease [Thermoanaerobaculia bacterium]